MATKSRFRFWLKLAGGLLATLFLLGGAVLWSNGFGRGVTKKLDVVYGEAGGQKLLLDVYEPATGGSKLRPAVVVVHGGAWSAGDRKEGAEIGTQLARLGYVAFSIEYRLVTETADHWPAQLDDCQRAVRWVRARAAEYRIDPRRVGALGGSAGGHLVACLGTRETRDNSDPALASYSSRPTCIVDLAGPTDLTEDLAPKVKEGAWCNEMIRILLGATPAAQPAQARSASPLFDADAHSAPALILAGKTDPIVPLDHAERFAAALQKAGIEAKLVTHDGGHGFDDAWSLVRCYLEMKGFLARHLRP